MGEQTKPLSTILNKRKKGQERKFIKKNINKKNHITARLKEQLQAAAARTLRGDGCNPFLPPLPTCPGIDISSSTSHPYGVLPFGNKYTSDDSDCRSSLGPTLRALNDEQIMNILSFVDAQSLSQVTQTCHFFYALGHAPDLWRDLMLRREQVISCFKSSWRDTYVYAHVIHSKTDFKDSYIHKPFRVKGLFSDLLYRSYVCSTFHFDASHMDNNPEIRTIPHLDNEIAKKDPDHFFQNYEKPNRPCVLTNVTQSWSAYKKWSDKKYFTDTISEITVFRATSAAAPLPASFTMKAYFEYCSTFTSSNQNLSEEAPLYLFDRTFDVKAPNLIEDYQKDLYQSCPYFNPTIPSHQHDLFHVLGENSRPDHRWIIMGPSQNHSGSAFHIDPNATHAWNAPLSRHSSKYWIFYPPGVSPPGIHPSPNGDDVAMPISLGEWFLTYWDEHVRQRSNKDISKRPLEGIVRPGELLFVPHGWWHLVLNLEEQLPQPKEKQGSNENKIEPHPCAIAVTQNYVSGRNLSDVLRFLQTRKQQISGCRDRSDAIQPENLYGEFSKQIQKYNQTLWNTSKQQADLGWMCDAWKDDCEAAEIEETNNSENEEDNPNPSMKKKKMSVLERAKLSTLQQDSSSVSKSDSITTSDAETSSNSGKFTFSFL